jgi:hypothetical protein
MDVFHSQGLDQTGFIFQGVIGVGQPQVDHRPHAGLGRDGQTGGVGLTGGGQAAVEAFEGRQSSQRFGRRPSI